MTPELLISLDFDGTLCLENTDPPVDPAIHAALARWRVRGALWLINTGRSLPHTLEGLMQGGFEHKPDYLVTRERDLFTRNAVGRWIPFGAWNERCEDEQRRLLKKAKGVIKEVRAYLKKHTLATYFDIPEEPAGIVASNPEEMDVISAFVDTLLPRVPNLHYERNSIYLRFSHSGFTKGTALAHLAASLGLDAASVFAAGDNFNDLTMLNPAVARHLACPSNAIPEVRRHVLSQGGHCSDLPGAAGTAEALDRLLDLAKGSS